MRMPSSKLIPASLVFSGDTPYSTLYQDVYHSTDGGLGQASHVFLKGCGLPDAWAGRDAFTVLETGFGTGLNFLATWFAWRADPARSQRLHFLSVEKHPFSAADLRRLHAAWPELASLSSDLIKRWPPLVSGFYRLEFDEGRVQLTLMLGDASACLHQLEARVDAFYLDGFSPDRNADLWHSDIFGELSRLANPGATAASYTVASSVRNGLTKAGFRIAKRAGYGRKRHCLTGVFSKDKTGLSPGPRHVAVIGAGVAGAGVAHGLARRGVDVTILERGADAANAASGNPAAVFRPVVSSVDHISARLTRAAFVNNLAAWPDLGEDLIRSSCGVLHIAKDETAAQKQKAAIEANSLPADFARWVDASEASDLADWPIDQAGVLFPGAGWIVPASLCKAWLRHPHIALQYGCKVASIKADKGEWTLYGEGGRLLLKADAVVLANAQDAISLVPEQGWPLQVVRGQITRLPMGVLPQVRRVLAREGYVSPTPDGLIVGATYEHDNLDTHPRRESDESNLARLESILPGAAGNIDIERVIGRASLRAVLPDRLPLLGPVNGRQGVYIAAGYASRGVVWAGLLGETLTSMMLHEPLPLEREVVYAISPARFKKKQVPTQGESKTDD
jgi:tRNA 5-methylaminomethyl-2-thiouridine biosynthesis bifunctional protein